MKNLQIVYDFEGMVATFILLRDLRDFKIMKNNARDDIFWKIWTNKKDTKFVYRIIFDSRSEDQGKRAKVLQNRFDEKVKSVWRDDPDIHVFLFLNFQDPPQEWTEKKEKLTIFGLSDILKEISEKNWTPIFNRYFGRRMYIGDAEKCEFLNPISKPLATLVDDLSIKETINVISWLRDIAFYRPADVLAFCDNLFHSKKTTEEERHPLFGTTILNRKDYLEQMQDLLQSVAAHIDYFEDALELLLRISYEIDADPRPIWPVRSQYVDNVTGYYYGRDFIVKDDRALYVPDFNQKTLDVIERMLGEKSPIGLYTRCISVIPNLLKMKVESSTISRRMDRVTFREYRLPLQDQRLKEVRKRALSILFASFDKFTEKEIKSACLAELLNALQYSSLSEELKDEFHQVLMFLEKHAEEGDPSMLSQALKIIDYLTRAEFADIKSKAQSLKEKIGKNFELRLYHVLFGDAWSDLFDEEIKKAVQDSFDAWGSEPKQFIEVLNGFYMAAESYGSGIMSYLSLMGKEKPEFSFKVIMTISKDSGFRKGLSLYIIRSIGYLLCGIRRSNARLWHEAVTQLKNQSNKSSTIIALTGFQIHNYTEFTSEDIKVISDLVSDADEEIRILGAETLWYFQKYEDFTELLYVYENLSRRMTTKLAQTILKGLASGISDKEFAEKWDDKERIGILKKILLTMVDFNKFEWYGMEGYHLEILLRVVWKHSTKDMIDFFRQRLAPERMKREGYDPLPYDLNHLFQNVSDEKQNEFISAILDWDIDKYGVYWLARLVGLSCKLGIGAKSLDTLKAYIDSANTKELVLAASLLDEFQLGENFYDLAMKIVKKGYRRKAVREQLVSSFISKTGGSRSAGQPFPSHIQHKELIAEFRSRYNKSKKVQKFLDQWEANVDELIRRDKEEDLER